MDQASPIVTASEIASNERILSLSWNIATEPKLYRELAPNPYSHHAGQIISERFPQIPVIDVIRALILAEPEGMYDWNYKQLPKPQQAEELSQQNFTATERQTRLSNYCGKYATELGRLSNELLYDRLSMLVFESADLKLIELKYAQQPRKNLRWSIISYIENIQRSSFEKQKDTDSVSFIYTLGKKSDSKRAVGITVFTVLSCIVLFIYFNELYQKQSTERQTDRMPQAKGQGQILASETRNIHQSFPLRLKIPSISVDTAVEYMGITTDGTMAVPDDTVNVGWYKYGPSPGEKGNAVISGHFDGRTGKSGVFNNLDTLEQGDKIYVINDLGTTLTFAVRESRTYSPGYADEVFLSNDNGIHLNLVTCDGLWDGTQKSYSKRLVVFADIIL